MLLLLIYGLLCLYLYWSWTRLFYIDSHVILQYQFCCWYIFSWIQCSFVEHRTYKIVYRRYASLFFLVGVDNEEVSYSYFIFFNVYKAIEHFFFGSLCSIFVLCISEFTLRRGKLNRMNYEVNCWISIGYGLAPKNTTFNDMW